MHLSTRLLGKHTIDLLEARATAAVLRIGKDAFTRADLSTVACWNFVAAANLSAILNRELKVKDTREVFETLSPKALAFPRLGAITLAVLGAAFEVQGLGTLQDWATRHTKGGAEALVTFATLKARDAKAHAETTKTLTRRTAARRQQAHRLRVQRFTTRQSKKAALA